jgi:hypothetical protein
LRKGVVVKRLVILVSMAAVFGALLLAGVAAALVLPSGTHKKCVARSAKTHTVKKTTAKTVKKTTAKTCATKKSISKKHAAAKPKSTHPDPNHVTTTTQTPSTTTTTTGTTTTEDENDDAQCDEDDDDTTTTTTTTTTCAQGDQGDNDQGENDGDSGED